MMVQAPFVCPADSAEPSTTVVATLLALAILDAQALSKETDVLLVGAHSTFVSTAIGTTALSFTV